jgi:hypothetical protein
MYSVADRSSLHYIGWLGLNEEVYDLLKSSNIWKEVLPLWGGGENFSHFKKRIQQFSIVNYKMALFGILGAKF